MGEGKPRGKHPTPARSSSYSPALHLAADPLSPLAERQHPRLLHHPRGRKPAFPGQTGNDIVASLSRKLLNTTSCQGLLPTTLTYHTGWDKARAQTPQQPAQRNWAHSPRDASYLQGPHPHLSNIAATHSCLGQQASHKQKAAGAMSQPQGFSHGDTTMPRRL